MKLLEFGCAFVLALEEKGILQNFLDQVVDKEKNLTTKQVIEDMFLEYGMNLFSKLGNEDASVYYWGLAGKKGETMLSTISLDQKN